MTGSKVFAGIKVRRMRNKLGLSQSALADSLGISPSYMNLIERDQRPLTAQIILKLSSMAGADIGELTDADGNTEILAALKEVTADPLLAGEIPTQAELVEASQSAPNLVSAVIKLHGAYREVLNRLSDISQQISTSDMPPAKSPEFPFEKVKHWLLAEGPWFHGLETLAEEIWVELSPKDDVMAALKSRLRAHSGIDVRVLPKNIMPTDLARYDRHSQRLFLSERLDAIERLMEVARLVANLEGRVIIDDIIAHSQLAENAECIRLARQSLIQKLAIAILCPAAKFNAAAQDLQYDIEALESRFCVKARTVMQRMACLSAATNANLQIGYLMVDRTGAAIEHAGKLGFFLPRIGALCGRLPVFDRGQNFSAVQLETADHARICMIVANETESDGLVAAICIASKDVSKTVYGPQFEGQKARPIGTTCRLCELSHCDLRREPPTTRPVALNEYVRGATDYEPM
jgi:XRE family transcriptional regulator, fatty acid utilization regulator